MKKNYICIRKKTNNNKKDENKAISMMHGKSPPSELILEITSLLPVLDQLET